MVARARLTDESFVDYRDSLKVEAYDLKLRLRLGPTRWKAFKAYMATQMINLDEDKNDKTSKS